MQVNLCSADQPRQGRNKALYTRPIVANRRTKGTSMLAFKDTIAGLLYAPLVHVEGKIK